MHNIQFHYDELAASKKLLEKMDIKGYQCLAVPMFKNRCQMVNLVRTFGSDHLVKIVLKLSSWRCKISLAHQDFFSLSRRKLKKIWNLKKVVASQERVQELGI